MAEGGSSDALREQLAALTRRVYRLETLLTELTGRQLAEEIVPSPPPLAAAEPARGIPVSRPPLETSVASPEPPRAALGRAHSRHCGTGGGGVAGT